MSLKVTAFKITLFKILISDDIPDNSLTYLLPLPINLLSVMSRLILELGYQVLL